MVETIRSRPKIKSTIINNEDPENSQNLILDPDEEVQPIQQQQQPDGFEFLDIDTTLSNNAEIDENDNRYIIEEIDIENIDQEESRHLENEEEAAVNDLNGKIRDILDNMGSTINQTLGEFFKSNNASSTNQNVEQELGDLYCDLHQLFNYIQVINRNMCFMFRAVGVLSCINAFLVGIMVFGVPNIFKNMLF